MKIKQLIQGLENLQVRGSKEVEVTGLTANSHTVAPGNLFIAKKGAHRDGSEFISQALEAGAVAILTSVYNPFLKQTQILYDKPEEIEAKFAARYYRNPSKELFVAGVTGTKGKTTVSHLLHHLLNGLGKLAGLSSSVETVVGEKRFSSALTTHDVIHNQKILREMVSAGSKAAVLEISSHGLKQGRVEEIDFDIAVFTNLYPDHLDYHETIEQYAAEKRKLFRKAPMGIFNADSSWADFMKEEGKGLTYGIANQADIMASEIHFERESTFFNVIYRGVKQKFVSPLVGRFNISNLLAVIAVGVHLGANLSLIAEIFSKIPPIPGRLAQVPSNRGFRVFIDSAHMGDALDNVLSALREIGDKRLIVVFGGGGDRDPGRRKGMAAAAEKWADVAIVTSDNPRSEDPEEICRQVFAGFRNPAFACLEVDRKKAIYRSIDLAKAGDIVLIAGRGHETVQIQGSQRIPFDDFLIAREYLLT